MSQYLHPGDVVIDREYKAGKAVIFDCDGRKVFEFDASTTDPQIMESVAFANQAYGDGVRWGGAERAASIRAALGLHDAINHLEDRLDRKYGHPEGRPASVVL